MYKGLKIGMFGLCEPDWIGTLNPAVISEILEVRDFLQTAEEMVQLLKDKGCDYIIALTHMRLPNDRMLA
jgi:5'-nucleotidase